MGDGMSVHDDLSVLQAALEQLEQLDQGVTVFDSELRLVGWNQRFFELLGFPLTLAKRGTHFSAFMRYNAERGEYGQGEVEALVEARVNRAREFQAHVMERIRPSGEVIAVRGTPLPQGGFVTTYTDISEQRQYILETDGLTKEFKGFVAVNNVGLKVREGTIHALIGPNGAGKTTVFNLLTRFLSATDGVITYKGHDITHTRPDTIARRGIVRSFQISSVFPHLTVRENVRIALQRKHGIDKQFWRPARELNFLNEEADGLLAEVALDAFADTLAVELSYGRKRALEIATTLALDPELMLLDEPTQGMGHEDVGRITDLIRKVATNRTILMVEHNLGVVANLSHWITVLQRGEILAEGNYGEVSRNPDVIRAYMGTAHA
ncbi:PAS-domain containing protein [Sedimenticola sp.]|uniref:PAS-domain containing protein n=1 Tax=Sedimenticola sp. TaxID=1940285 RepID=UPI003D0DEE87